MPQQLMRPRHGDLAKVMAEKNVNGRQLAREAGVGDPLISYARHGRPIRRSAAAAICGALRVPISSLFDELEQGATDGK